MAAVTIRNLSDEAHRALKAQAVRHGHSTEAELRAIIEDAVRPRQRVRLGTALSKISQKHGVTDTDIAAIEASSGTMQAEPMSFK